MSITEVSEDTVISEGEESDKPINLGIIMDNTGGSEIVVKKEPCDLLQETEGDGVTWQVTVHQEDEDDMARERKEEDIYVIATTEGEDTEKQGCEVSTKGLAGERVNSSFAHGMSLVGGSSSENAPPYPSPSEVITNKDFCGQLNSSPMLSASLGRETNSDCLLSTETVQGGSNIYCSGHQKIHTGESTIHFKFDEMPWIQVRQCETHQETPTNAKLKKCQFCDKSFFTKQHLERHEMTHTDQLVDIQCMRDS